MWPVNLFPLSPDVPPMVVFLTRPISVNIFFFVAAIADIGLILFASEKAKNLGGGHGALFLNFRPEVPEKNFRKQIFDEKSIFPRFQKFF